MRLIRFLPPIMIALASAGCGNGPEDKIVGIWVGDKTASKIPNIPIPRAEERFNQFMQNSLLKIRSDKTFYLSSGASVGGKWTLVGTTLTLVPDKGGITGPFGEVAKKMEGKVSADSRQISFEQATPLGSVILVLHKSG